ncbi:SRPBCC domain-containing protein [Loktanella sp. Alg231-35]|uniref:SRPBCC domain-containing protein n=1 Tax=Loktanella sp. Alg231-35 TaxID=1922220 RepID=UPI000D55BF11|nr:SRPBCC domain-containing protein [Loktanella sp. Alg231-35]
MPLDTKSFDLHRTLPLAPDRLWPVLTDPKEREKWNGPDADTMLVTDVANVIVGGMDRHRFGPADAPEFEVETRWYDLTKAERAVFSETLIFGGAAVCTSLVTYALDGKGTQTELGITVAVSSFSGPETLAEVAQGWEGGLDNLTAYSKSVIQQN